METPIGTKERADAYLIAYLKETHSIAIKHYNVADFALNGDETESEIEGYADDFANECDTDQAEYNASAQDRYNDQNEYAIIQSERYEQFRNEY